MIIKSYELKKKLKKENNIYLLYGQNYGLIDEIINRDLKPIFSKNVYNYEENELLSEKNNFLESLVNESLFEKDRLIIISRVTDKIFNLIQEIFEKKIENLKIILKSDNLEKKSKLRNFFEKDKNLVIVPFYEDTYQSLNIYIRDFFIKNKIKISAQNINFILEKSKGNRMNLKNELEKIKHLSISKKSIEFSDLLKLSCSNENHAISELADQCLAKNKRKTISMLNEYNASIDDNIMILKSLLFKLKRLMKLKKQLKINNNHDQVISSFKPTIFWKDKEIIKQQLITQSSNEIQLSIKEINKLEMLIKKNSSLSNQIVNNFILEKLETSNNLI